jgi:glycosyltransferase involved in cell wall biosynthesis
VKLNLTIIIPTLNEAKILHSCLDAIGNDFADKVIVVDSGSTDATCKIAEEWGAEVIQFNWNGSYPKKRNWFLLNHTPKSEWVLFLDADEIISDYFKHELRKTLHHTSMNGFWLNYSIHFMGKKLRGGYPLNKLALFCVGKGLYERIDEDHWSHLDMEIHEHPIIDGEVGYIKSQIDHVDDRGFDHYIAKHNEYAKWEALRLMKSKNNPVVRKSWTWKQNLKYSLMSTPFLAPLYFLGAFFLMGGLIDGIRGFKFASLKARYFWKIYQLSKT